MAIKYTNIFSAKQNYIIYPELYSRTRVVNGLFFKGRLKGFRLEYYTTLGACNGATRRVVNTNPKWQRVAKIFTAHRQLNSITFRKSRINTLVSRVYYRIK